MNVQTIESFIDNRIENIFKRPLAWGDRQAIELQLHTLFELKLTFLLPEHLNATVLFREWYFEFKNSKKVLSPLFFFNSCTDEQDPNAEQLIIDMRDLLEFIIEKARVLHLT